MEKNLKADIRSLFYNWHFWF